MSRQFVQTIEQALLPLADAQNALAMSAYMRGKFVYLGLTTPQRRAATKAAIRAWDDDPLTPARALWRKREREYQYVACDLLRHHMHRLGGAALATLAELVQSKSWWDTVDALAPVVGNIVLRERSLAAEMDHWIVEDGFWLRRVAILHQLAWKQDTEERRLFQYCLQCAPEQEFFIRKAIGWALRQYARTAPDAVRRFVDKNRSKLSGLSVREATKHL
ncbi:MAG TPA: DNA alkylation repair protein [Burkholderiaceae bacterium]